MPAVKILHSSDAIEGQIFIPAVNLLVAAGTIGVTAGLGSVNSGAALTNAYGFAVAYVFSAQKLQESATDPCFFFGGKKVVFSS